MKLSTHTYSYTHQFSNFISYHNHHLWKLKWRCACCKLFTGSNKLTQLYASIFFFCRWKLICCWFYTLPFFTDELKFTVNSYLIVSHLLLYMRFANKRLDSVEIHLFCYAAIIHCCCCRLILIIAVRLTENCLDLDVKK